MNLIAKVKSTEYFVPSFMLVMYRVIAGPCDLTVTNLKMGLAGKEFIFLLSVSNSEVLGLTSTEIKNNFLSQAELPHSLCSGERSVGVSEIMHDR